MSIYPERRTVAVLRRTAAFGTEDWSSTGQTGKDLQRWQSGKSDFCQ